MTYPWQRDQWQQLIQAYQHNRLSHAYLLTGISGLGKTDFAKAFSAILLCDEPNQSLPCGQCKGCRLFRANTHPDYIEVTLSDKAKSIKIDQIRFLTQQLNQKSQRGGYQVVLVSPADKMPVGAANALLKTLEEPPGDVLIFLVADCAAHLPATIMSRCQKLTFQADESPDTIRWLQNHVNSDEDLSLLFSIANHAPLRVNTLIKNDYLSLRNDILKHLFYTLSKRVSPILPVPQWIKKDCDLVFYALITIAVDLSRIKYGIIEDLVNSDCIPQLEKIGQLFSDIALQHWLSAVLEKQQLFTRGANLNMQLLFENLLIEWSKIRV